jgi:hypothetical protein
MKQSKRYVIFVLISFAVFTILLLFTGYFNIGLLSDDYMNFFDASHSTLIQKFTGSLPFTNPSHFRPAYYVSLQVSLFLHNALGFKYDDFVFYRVQNLVIFFIISFLAGWIVLHQTKKTFPAVIAALAVILFPNNINNICWTAGRVDLLCGMFYLAAFYFSVRYLDKPSKQGITLASILFILALISKETALTFPFVLVIYMLFMRGSGSIRKYKYLPVTMFVILLIYFLYRFAVLSAGYNRYYEISYLNVLLKSIISLIIPFDFLTLKSQILSGNILLIIYIAVLFAGLILIVYSLVKEDSFKPFLVLTSLSVILLSPYLYAGYIRPQMILIPLALIIIFLILSLNRLNILNRNRTLLLWKFPLFAFWIYYSAGLTCEWNYSYKSSRERMVNLLKVNVNPDRNTIIIGNAGRFRQSFLFDKLTGAYGFWKNRKFAINDTINDIIQTGALDENSLNSKLNYKILQPGEFEISTAGSTQYFYMEGFEDDKSKWLFSNKDMSVKAVGYNNLNKPTSINLKILSEDADCYLADGTGYIKIY